MRGVIERRREGDADGAREKSRRAGAREKSRRAGDADVRACALDAALADRSSGRAPAVPDSLTGTCACGRFHRTRGHEPARHR
eukprot:4727950-Prymnesium_polylepis.1